MPARRIMFDYIVLQTRTNCLKGIIADMAGKRKPSTSTSCLPCANLVAPGPGESESADHFHELGVRRR